MTNNQGQLPTDIERRAYVALTQAFCELRYYAKRPLNAQGKEHLFLVADAAHNIPSALAGNTFFVETLERDVETLEAMLGKMNGGKDQGFYSRDAESTKPFIPRQPKLPTLILTIFTIIIGWSLVSISRDMTEVDHASVTLLSIGLTLLVASWAGHVAGGGKLWPLKLHETRVTSLFWITGVNTIIFYVSISRYPIPESRFLSSLFWAFSVALIMVGIASIRHPIPSDNSLITTKFKINSHIKSVVYTLIGCALILIGGWITSNAESTNPISIGGLITALGCLCVFMELGSIQS